MPHVANRNTVGFEPIYNNAGFPANPVPYELLPNTAFTKGMLVCFGRPGQAAVDGFKIRPMVAADAIANVAVVGVMAENIPATNNPAAGCTYGLVYDNPLQVFRATVIPGVNGINAGGDVGTTTTLVVASVTVNDALNGSLIYFYNGPGAPAVRTIVDSVAATNTISWIKPLAAATSVLTKFVLLAASVDVAGVNVGSQGLAVNNDSLRVNVTAPAATAPLNCLAIDPESLTMDVMIRAAAHFKTR